MIAAKIYHKKGLSPADEGELTTLIDSMRDSTLHFDRFNSTMEFTSKSCDLCEVNYLWGIIMRQTLEFGIKKIEFQYEEVEE